MDRYTLQRTLEDIEYHVSHGEMDLAESKRKTLPKSLKAVPMEHLPFTVTDELWNKVT